MARAHSHPTPLAQARPVAPRRLSHRALLRWRALAAGLLSIALPGLGHLLIGERRRGCALLAISAGIVALLVLAAPRDPFALLAMAVQPRNLLWFLVLDIVLLAFRGYAVVDAFRRALSHPPIRRTQPGLVAAGLLLVALTAAPHVAAGYYDLVTYRFLNGTFNGNVGQQEAVAPSEVQLTRDIRLNDGITPAAPPSVAEPQE